MNRRVVVAVLLLLSWTGALANAADIKSAYRAPDASYLNYFHPDLHLRKTPPDDPNSTPESAAVNWGQPMALATSWPSLAELNRHFDQLRDYRWMPSPDNARFCAA